MKPTEHEFEIFGDTFVNRIDAQIIADRLRDADHGLKLDTGVIEISDDNWKVAVSTNHSPAELREAFPDFGEWEENGFFIVNTGR